MTQLSTSGLTPGTNPPQTSAPPPPIAFASVLTSTPNSCLIASFSILPSPHNFLSHVAPFLLFAFRPQSMLSPVPSPALLHSLLHPSLCSAPWPPLPFFQAPLQPSFQLAIQYGASGFSLITGHLFLSITPVTFCLDLLPAHCG